MRIMALGLVMLVGLVSGARAQGYANPGYPVPGSPWGTSLQGGPGGFEYRSSGPANGDQPYASPVWGGQPRPGAGMHAYLGDREAARRAQRAAARMPLGRPVSWTNAATGNHGSSWAIDEPQPGHRPGDMCRGVEERLWINGVEHRNRGLVCVPG